MGANTGTQQSQLNSQNAAQQAAQASQNQLLQQNNSALSPYLSGTQGYTPQQLASMNSQALDQNAQKYDAAQQQTNAQVSARGDNGMTPTSGVAAGAYGNLQASKAGDLSSSLQNISLNNAQQALANKFNAASVLSGNAQTYAGNVGTYGSGASNALGQYTTASQNGLGSQLLKGLGAGLGAGLSATATGGLGTGLTNLSAGNSFF